MFSITWIDWRTGNRLVVVGDSDSIRQMYYYILNDVSTKTVVDLNTGIEVELN